MIDLKKTWRIATPAVLFNPGEKRNLLIRVPFDPENQNWLTHGKQRGRIKWNPTLRCWVAPRSWFERLAVAIAVQLGSVLIVQVIDREQQCNDSCMNAKGLECVCGCEGRNHGLGNPHGWARYVDEHDTCELNGRRYACRLVRSPYAGRFTGLVAEAPSSPVAAPTPTA